MVRCSRLRKPTVAEAKQLRWLIEMASEARQCHRAEILLLYAMRLIAITITDALRLNFNAISRVFHLFKHHRLVRRHPHASQGNTSED
jgi:hypothetical protein